MKEGNKEIKMMEIPEFTEKIETEEVTENLVEEKRSNNNSKTRKKLLIFGITFGVVIIGLVVVLVLNGQKTASIAKELELGEKYLEEGLYEEAKLAFDKVIEIDKKEVKGYEGKAEVAIILKEYPEAEALLNEATVIKETDESQILMAEVYINTERKEEGKTLLNEVKNNGMENLKTVEKAAELYNQLQEYNSTIELLEEKIIKTENKEELKKLYDALIDVYVKVGKSEEELVTLLERAAKAIEDPSYIEKKDELLVKVPNFSLVPGEYEGVQNLEIIKGKEEDQVYYTLDGTEPTTNSSLYTEEIILKSGEWVIKAIEVNKNGTKSKVVAGHYIIRDSPEESFKNNIRGTWSAVEGVWTHTYVFDNGNLYYTAIKPFSGDGFSASYSMEANSGGTSGKLTMHNVISGGLTPGSLVINIDCKPLGDGSINIDGYAFKYDGEPKSLY